MRITTVGDGAMATVCSILLAENGHRVCMWIREESHRAAMTAARENALYLPGVKLPGGIELVDDVGAFGGAEVIVAAVPTQYMRGVFTRLRGVIGAEEWGREKQGAGGAGPSGGADFGAILGSGTIPVISVAKGIENGTLMRPTQIIREVLGERGVAALSGPNIAGELAKKLPATAVAASEEEGLGRMVMELFTTPYLRVYGNDDLLGVELAGALKNVIALAAGILDGMGVGNNAKAALLTRGLVEITRLGVAMGAKAETFAGLAGLGDLVTTCVSPEGRNRTFGERVGRGEKPEEVLRQMVGVVEGVTTTRSVVELARRHGVEMPISEGLYEVLFAGKEPRKGIAELMAREPKRE